MMNHDIGRLQAYVDGELAAAERADVARHLDSCDICQAELVALDRSAAAANFKLDALNPLPTETASAHQALAAFPARTRPQTSSLWDTLSRRLNNVKLSLYPQSTAWRVAAVGLTALAILAALFTIAPAREAMAQFLGVFRVRKFVAIPIPDSQRDQLEELQAMLDSGAFGEPEYLREPGEPQEAASAAEAESLAGFSVKTPAELPEGATRTEMSVVHGPHVRMNIDRGMMEMALAMLGVEDVDLPAVDEVTAEVDVPPIVYQSYAIDNPNGERDATVSILQAPAPDVDIPPGIDPAAMGELFLRTTGVSAEEARRLAQTIDWTSTLVIPIPSDIGDYQELKINGQPALLIRSTPDNMGNRQRLLLWQQDGIVYAIEGSNLADSAMMQLAESMQ